MNGSRYAQRFVACGVISTGVMLIGASAQDAPPPETPPETPPPTQPTPKQEEQDKKTPPSLDDLLGLEETEEDSNATDAADREIDEELQRELTEQQIMDAFKLAVEKMEISADLLDTQFDPGLGTQRVQEDIIAKLEQLIDQAKKMNQSASSSSSSSSQQQKESSQDPGKQDKQGQQSESEQRNQNPQDSGEGGPPSRQEGDLNTLLEETRQEWGSLPERIRNMLLQGRRGKFSSMYDRMTREYYRRLAENDAR